MCFSAEASFGAAVALLPAGAYCVESAWRKDRDYMLLAVVPVLFGLQQVCEGIVWVGLERDNVESVRVAALGYLFFALAVWPIWIPLAVAAVERSGWKRWVMLALSGIGVLLAIVYYVPVASDAARGLKTGIVGHSIRYEVAVQEMVGTSWWWIWPLLYLAVVSGPLLASRVRGLRSLGTAVVISAMAAYGLYEFATASVWCFFAALLSLKLAHVLFQLPEPSVRLAEPKMLPAASH